MDIPDRAIQVGRAREGQSFVCPYKFFSEDIKSCFIFYMVIRSIVLANNYCESRFSEKFLFTLASSWHYLHLLQPKIGFAC
jgi:hypothetical protein